MTFHRSHTARLALTLALLCASYAGANNSQTCKRGFGRFVTFAKAMLSLGYDVQVNGMEEVLKGGKKGMLILTSHPAFGIDAMTVVSTFGKLDPAIALNPIAKLHSFVDAKYLIEIPVMTAHPSPELIAQMKEAHRKAAEALNRGENVILFPAGRLQEGAQDQILGTSSLFEIMQAAPNARVVYGNITGLRGSRFSLTANPQFNLSGAFFSAAGELAGNLFMPHRRKVTVTVTEDKEFPRNGTKQEMNARVQERLNNRPNPIVKVNRWIWGDGAHVIEPEPPVRRSIAEGEVKQADIDRLLPDVVRIIRELIPEYAGEIRLDDDVKDNLGITSLHAMDLIAALEKKFRAELDKNQGKDYHIANSEDIRKVGDIIKIIVGAKRPTQAKLTEPSKAWNKQLDALKTLTMPAKDRDNVMAVFLRQAEMNPNGVFAHDERGGEITYRQAITRIFMMLPHLQKLEGDAVGVMLPPSVGGYLTNLALLFAGKRPVQLNYSAGPEKIGHAVEDSGVKHILTSGTFQRQLEAKNISIGDHGNKIVDMDKLKEEIQSRKNFFSNAMAFLKGRFSWSELKRTARKTKPEDEQVSLFTTGSSGRPKMVTLTNDNLNTNWKDFEDVIQMGGDTVLLSALPFFHIFGYNLSNMVILSGGKVVFHPDSTDPVTMARLIPQRKVTHLVGTPSIVNGVLDRASVEDLKSIKMVVTGGEALRPDVILKIKEKIPHAEIWEGYGLTETSPVLTAGNQPGSVGKPMRRVQLEILDPDSIGPGKTPKPAEKGQPGVIVVRGRSIFSGYDNVKPEDQPFFAYEPGGKTTGNEGQKWFNTEDLGYYDDAGNLRLTGRLSRRMKIGGELEGLDTLENHITTLNPRVGNKPELAVVGVEGTGTDYRLAVYTTKPLTLAEINAALAGKVNNVFKVNEVHVVDELPTLSGGLKTDYKKLTATLKDTPKN